VEKLNFKRIGILIGATLLISIGVQAWRMYSQFEIIQGKLVSDIQESLDNAVEAYFAKIAKTDVFALTDNLESHQSSGMQILVDSLPTEFPHDSVSLDIGEEFMTRVGKSELFVRNLQIKDSAGKDTFSWTSEDQVTLSKDSLNKMDVDQINQIRIFRGKTAADSINQLEVFTNKIIISLIRDSLDLTQIDTFLQEELDRRVIDINYKLVQTKGVLGEENQGLEKMPFKTVSSSTFLPQGQSLEIYFENTALTVLRRGIFEILTSIIFLGIISGAFYYLYQTIKNQKEIAEIKEDLIGNITHEFKTPIATTLSAIEGIEQFNPENDPDKVKKYLGISKMQLHKLNQMVEKLLETATLDSEQMVLKKETIDPEPILRNLLEKFRTLDPEKEIELILPVQIRPVMVDPFHFENVVSNLLDNALKYGGNQVRICMDQSNQTKIKIWDNGGKIGSEQKERVFEQFYRIPQGNIHDVKGFGIGLYYVKKIIEKHGGKIELETAPKSTTFTTIWP
jgi:two-component system phosphate regulon sensor histidine kinase PhoR